MDRYTLPQGHNNTPSIFLRRSRYYDYPYALYNMTPRPWYKKLLGWMFH